MKAVAIFFAILALAYATEEKDAKKPTEKQPDERHGLQWPLPDWSNEGDLMLHGVQFYERVGQLRQSKNINEVDKMVLAVGRDFLRRAHKFLASTADFKILPTLCRDSRSLNSSDRWEIRIQEDQQQPISGVQPPVQGQAEKPIQNDPTQAKKEGQEKEAQQKPQNDQPQQKQPQEQNELTHPRSKVRPDSANETNANVTNEIAVQQPTNQKATRDSAYETEREEFYERMGVNFARLLMKRFRKETLSAQETEYLAHWENDAAVHYGAMGIYCLNEENAKNIVKILATYIDEKQQ